MGKNMYSEEEMRYISKILTLEEHACKKARLYGRTLSNKKLAEEMKTIADRHLARYLSILNSL